MQLHIWRIQFVAFICKVWTPEHVTLGGAFRYVYIMTMINQKSKLHTCMLFLFTSYVSQLSVEKAMASNATATMADIVAKDNVTAEHGILFCVCVVDFA